MKKLLPLLLALLGTGAGVGAGIFLAPPPAAEEGTEMQGEQDGDHAEDSHEEDHDEYPEEEDAGDHEYVKLNNQFIVPVVVEERVQSLVVLSLSLEVAAGGTEQIYSLEPKLRDIFLRALFDHANVGGFEGNFTEASRIDLLRRMLLEGARHVLGSTIKAVLITEIARQDA